MFLKKILATFAVSCLNVNVKLDKLTANTRVKKRDGLGMNKFDVLLLRAGVFCRTQNAERRTPNDPDFHISYISTYINYLVFEWGETELR